MDRNLDFPIDRDSGRTEVIDDDLGAPRGQQQRVRPAQSAARA